VLSIGGYRHTVRQDKCSRLKLARFRTHRDRARELIKPVAVVAISLCVLSTVQAASAQSNARNPVALVVERRGRTSPELQPYSEIMAGDAFRVPASSSLVFIDYHSCNRVTVSGTTVNFSSSGFSTSTGANRSEERIACPQTLATDSGGENSSILMRGLDTMPSVAIRPDFVIIASPGRSFARVSVKDATRTLVDAELHGARFDWPSSAPPLDDGSIYRLVLVPERADDRPLKLSFRAAADSLGAPQTIVLIHALR
jgi:hypothetical protein